MSSELSTLVDLIATQVKTIENVCATQNTTVPSVDEPSPAPGTMRDPSFIRAADIAVAAAFRIIASLLDPNIALMRTGFGMYGSALLNVVIEANVTEALREAGTQGVHINDLGTKVGIEPSLLGRVLRYLSAVHHTYRELSPNVFTNNWLSAALDTGKPFDEVKDRGPHRYTGSKGFAAAAGHMASDEALKGAAFLPDVILQSDAVATNDATKSAVMKAVGYDGDFFKWIEEDTNKKVFHRFGVAMKNLESIFTREVIVATYAWGDLPKGGIVVDVGGGIGGTTLPLAKSFPDLRFVIQDRPQVIDDANKHWKQVFPQALESGFVKLQGHNFFEPQPVKDASAFILRYILHDWPDADSIRILQHLRAAAGPETKLIIMETIVPYACPIKENTADPRNIPEVLQGNLAPGGGFPYGVDVQMMNILNAKQRTIEEWTELIGAGGFKVEFVNPGLMSVIICTPA